jgi:hypothetical protein
MFCNFSYMRNPYMEFSFDVLCTCVMVLHPLNFCMCWHLKCSWLIFVIFVARAIHLWVFFFQTVPHGFNLRLHGDLSVLARLLCVI